MIKKLPSLNQRLYLLNELRICYDMIKERKKLDSLEKQNKKQWKTQIVDIDNCINISNINKIVMVQYNIVIHLYMIKIQRTQLIVIVQIIVQQELIITILIMIIIFKSKPQ